MCTLKNKNFYDFRCQILSQNVYFLLAQKKGGIVIEQKEVDILANGKQLSDKLEIRIPVSRKHLTLSSLICILYSENCQGLAASAVRSRLDRFLDTEYHYAR